MALKKGILDNYLKEREAPKQPLNQLDQNIHITGYSTNLNR